MEEKKQGFAMLNVKRVFSPSKESFFLFGPRGTGKSTWVRTFFPDALYFDLLLTDERHRFEAHPEELIHRVHACALGSCVVIDEIQKVPELLSIIHALIEEKRGIQFILNSSSACQLRRSRADLMAGRAIRKELHPFIAAELGSHFDLAEALKFGMLPLVWGTQEREEKLSSYVHLYVQEELQYEGLVRNMGSFSRFLSKIAFSHGMQLNVNNIARECEVKRSAAESFLSILHDLMLSYELPIFARRMKRQLSRHPKFYLFDSGVFRVLRQRGPLDSLSELEGVALEGLVLQHLKAWCAYSKARADLYFWRTKSGLEVDFVVYGEEGFWAIEVKNSTRLSSRDLRGLKHFCEDYPECTPILLYRGEYPQKIEGIICLPCADFLQNLLPNGCFV